METNPTETSDIMPPTAPATGAAATPPAQKPAGAPGPRETPAPAPGTDGATDAARLAALEARLAELEAENRALSLERAWNARAALEGIAHPALVEKWRPPDEAGIDTAMDDLKAFLDGFRKEQAAGAQNAHRPVRGGGETAARAPKGPTERGRAALDGFRRDSERAAG